MVNRPGRPSCRSNRTRIAGGWSNETLVSQCSRFESEFRSLSRSYCFQLIMNARRTVSFGAEIFKRGVACARKKHKDNATPERFFNSSKKSLNADQLRQKIGLKNFQWRLSCVYRARSRPSSSRRLGDNIIATITEISQRNCSFCN